MDKDKSESPLRSSCLTVTRSSIKSRSSNCLMDPAITPWLPGLSLTAPSTTNEWTNFKFDSPRPSREDGSSQSNSNFGANEQWASERVSSDKQRLKGSRRKRRAGKNKREKNLSSVEKGKDDDQLSPLGRKVIVFVAVFLFLLCILLVGVTLRLGPVIDEMGKTTFSSLYCLKKFFFCASVDRTRVFFIMIPK
ncbi:uncharacterized protein CDAR_491381 [Caerostris darwini]|uniref:Uncharacterized protein n=1 Tax=Caerostris darwini TaxID=1538125 RepID=A0AAV4XAW3_9ARAC|nr:uncharacterized protein CDAR_491381 [Caerostris darwini]